MPLKPQAQKILSELQRDAGKWVPGYRFIEMYIIAYSQRIGEIRRNAASCIPGHTIQSRRIDGSMVNEYRLVRVA